jgi:Mg-chelatase subunit ChlD
VTPFVAGLVTGGTMDISATSEVVRAGMKVEIALVLDVTSSMNEGTKLADMKDAARAFVVKMKEVSAKSIEPNSVKISLVPFSSTVRVDPAQATTASWMDLNGVAPINDQIFTTASATQHANRFTLFTTIGDPWDGCVEMRQAPYDVQDDAPSAATPATLYTPMFAVDEPGAKDDGIKANGYGSTFQNSYLDDGTSSSDWRVRQGSITKYKKTTGLNSSKGPNRGCGLPMMRRLTTDFTQLDTWIKDLKADGNTNIPMGLMWGWNTLTPHAPYSDGVAYGTPKHKKIIIVMTDGENVIATRDTPNDGTYAGTGYIWQRRVLKADGTPLEQGSSTKQRTAALDARLKLLCSNIKGKDVELYTIRVEVDTGDSELLKNCASGRDYYYDVKSSSTLTTVFQAIAGQIAALHLSK